jgi:hypothetical protein
VTKSLETFGPLRPQDQDVDEVVEDIENRPGNDATKDQTGNIHLSHTTSNRNRESIDTRESARPIMQAWIRSKLCSSPEADAKAGKTDPASKAALSEISRW